MDNKTVNSLWVSDKLGPLQIMCMKSYLSKGHDFHLYTYGTIANVPEGVILKDANSIIPENQIFIDLKNSYATFSDWFRITLLFKVGGWWVDSDTICLKYFDFEEPFVFATEIGSESGKIQSCNAVIKMAKNSDLGKNILEEISEKLSRVKKTDIRWTEIGAVAMKKHIDILDFSKYERNYDVFCPVNFFNFTDFLSNESLVFGENTYAVHLWNKMWEWSNISPEVSGRNNSFFEQIKRDYLNA